MIQVNRRVALTIASIGLAASAFGANAQAIKIGIVGPFSGPFAHYGTLFKNGAEAYIAAQGGKLGGKEVELIYRDTGGPNPGQTKTLVQELIVKDKVDYLGGFVFTPNAFAVAPLIQQSQTPTVIFNAATSAITDKSEFFIRTSYTLVAGDGADGAMGGEEQHQEGRHRGYRLRPGHRRRNGVEERVHEAGRHRRRVDPHADCNDRLRTLRAAHQGQWRAGGLHLPARRPAEPGLREGLQRERPGQGRHPVPRHRRNRRIRPAEVRRCGARPDHRLPLLGGARIGGQQEVHRGAEEARSRTRSPTTRRSAPGTACS